MARRKSEIGAIGLPIFAGYISLDPNKNLRGTSAVKIYREMVLDDPACAGFFNAARQLLRVDLGVEPAGQTRNDKKAALFLEQCVEDMRDSAASQLRQMYSFLWCGWSLHELVYKRRSGGGGSQYDDGRVGWDAWALRRQESLYRWQYDSDLGLVTGFMQRPAPTYDLRIIPLHKAIHIVADETDGSPEGVSPLRSMYRMWYFVKNLELLLGIALERFGTGLPRFKIDGAVGAALSADDITRLDAIGEGIVQNEQAFIRLPAGVDFDFVASPGLSADTYITVIDRFRNWMLASVLADFLALGLGDRGGAYALGKDKTELFLMALNGFQSRVLEALNRQAVTRLFGYNDFGTLTALPKLTLPAVKRYDLAAIGTFAQTLNQIGAFHATPEDEEWFRKISDMVDVNPATLKAYFEADANEIQTVGLPAQTQADATPIADATVDPTTAPATDGAVVDALPVAGRTAPLRQPRAPDVEALISAEMTAARAWAVQVTTDDA